MNGKNQQHPQKSPLPAELKIAVIEDDATIRRLLEINLAAAGCANVYPAQDGTSGLALVQERRPDIVLLDLMLPGLDGLSVCRRIRSDTHLASTGVIMLTAKGESEDIVAGLEAGADDYVTKPFSRSELVARISALRRRLAPPRIKDHDGLTVDESSMSALLDGRALSLTRAELAILSKFACHPGRVYTRAQLSQATNSTEGGERTIDVQIAGLRKKLGRWAEHIETVRGIGYRVI